MYMEQSLYNTFLNRTKSCTSSDTTNSVQQLFEQNCTLQQYQKVNPPERFLLTPVHYVEDFDSRLYH
jgi:hypothetical protein